MWHLPHRLRLKALLALYQMWSLHQRLSIVMRGEAQLLQRCLWSSLPQACLLPRLPAMLLHTATASRLRVHLPLQALRRRFHLPLLLLQLWLQSLHEDAKG